jgi:hypothetical protein
MALSVAIQPKRVPPRPDAARSAAMRIAFALAALILLGTFAPRSLHRPPEPPAMTWLAFEPVRLVEDAPERVRLGGLNYLGGWSVTSNDLRFGGISALHVERGEALAFSDAGWRIRFPVPPGATRVRAELAPLPQGPGDANTKSDRDVEAAVVEGDRAWLSFESANAVWRYRRPGWTSDSNSAPPALRRWESNGGGEAIIRFPDGRFLLLAEGQGGDSEAILFAGDLAVPGTAAAKLRYRPPRGYRVTDAALLPDGRALFLNRRFRLLSGFSIKLTVAELPERLEGALIEGREIADFGGVTHDNLEALSVTHEGGRTILWLASDDNYNPLQRTLLMKFALTE